MAVDLLIEILTGNATPKVANANASKGERLAGEYVIKVSLVMQACTFGACVLVLGVWHIRASQRALVTEKLRPLILALYASSALITSRCIYRIVEYFQGPDGEVCSHELYFWIFEAVFMLLKSEFLSIIHPALHLPQDNRVFLAMDGKTEVQGPGWKVSRKWYCHFADLFDLRSCCDGTKEKDS